MADENLPLTVTFSTSAAEQVAVMRAVGWRMLSSWFMLALFVVCPLVLLATAERRPHDDLARWAPVGVAVLGAIFWWFFPWYITWVARRGVAHPNGPLDVTLGSFTVRAQTPAGVMEWNWAALPRARETEHFFLLYVASSQVQFIPKRVLAQGQVVRVRELLRQALGGRGQLRTEGSS